MNVLSKSYDERMANYQQRRLEKCTGLRYWVGCRGEAIYFFFLLSSTLSKAVVNLSIFPKPFIVAVIIST